MEEGSREPEGRIQWFLLCNPKIHDLNQDQTDHLMSSAVDTGRQLNGYARVTPASIFPLLFRGMSMAQPFPG